MNCPRCSSLVLKDMAGEVGCPVCGWEYITPAQQSAVQRNINLDAARRTVRQRIRPAKHQGMKI